MRWFLLLFLCSFCVVWSQKTPIKNQLISEDIYINKQLKALYTVDKFNALAPAKAAFYSAVLPGLGQVYNKRYWKVPIVYGALATAAYFYVTNRNVFLRVRKAYRLRQYGLPDEFTENDGFQRLSTQALIHAQERLKKQMDESMFFLVGLYLLQVLEASVDAHLLQVKAQKTWAVRPSVNSDFITQENNFSLGLKLRYTF